MNYDSNHALEIGGGSADESGDEPVSSGVKRELNGSSNSDQDLSILAPDGVPKKAGRRKINIEFIDDKSRRHITFSKRKAGIMKKAYELSTLTGTQVLLLVASETGHVYTFATPKLQPLITKPEGKNLIQSCLNAPEAPPPSPPHPPVPTPTPTHARGGSHMQYGGEPPALYPPPPSSASDPLYQQEMEKEDKERRNSRGPSEQLGNNMGAKNNNFHMDTVMGGLAPTHAPPTHPYAPPHPPPYHHTPASNSNVGGSGGGVGGGGGTHPMMGYPPSSISSRYVSSTPPSPHMHGHPHPHPHSHPHPHPHTLAHPHAHANNPANLQVTSAVGGGGGGVGVSGGGGGGGVTSSPTTTGANQYTPPFPPSVAGMMAQFPSPGFTNPTYLWSHTPTPVHGASSHHAEAPNKSHEERNKETHTA